MTKEVMIDRMKEQNRGWPEGQFEAIFRVDAFSAARHGQGGRKSTRWCDQTEPCLMRCAGLAVWR